MYRFLILLGLFVGTGSSVSAQEYDSVPLIKKSYQVQVLVEHWRYGNPSWQTEFQTENAREAEKVADLFGHYLENNSLQSFLGYSWQWLVWDVRVKTVYEYRQLNNFELSP